MQRQAAARGDAGVQPKLSEAEIRSRESARPDAIGQPKPLETGKLGTTAPRPTDASIKVGAKGAAGAAH